MLFVNIVADVDIRWHQTIHYVVQYLVTKWINMVITLFFLQPEMSRNYYSYLKKVWTILFFVSKISTDLGQRQKPILRCLTFRDQKGLLLDLIYKTKIGTTIENNKDSYDHPSCLTCYISWLFFFGKFLLKSLTKFCQPYTR